MKVLISWLIANLEIVSVIILAPFVWMCLSNNPGDDSSDTSMWVSVLIMTFFVTCFGGMPTRGFAADIFGLVLTCVGVFAFIGMYVVEHLLDVLIGAGITGLVAGSAMAVYAVINFYDVVSLRWIYSTSSATKFEASIMYGFSRFCIGFHLGAFAYTLLAATLL